MARFILDVANISELKLIRNVLDIVNRDICLKDRVCSIYCIDDTNVNQFHDTLTENVLSKEQIDNYNTILSIADAPQNKVKHTLSEDAINGISINEKIRDEQLFEYEIRDREDFINTLIDWISEADGENKIMMMDDLELLMAVSDEYILSSNSTNSYLYVGCDEFDETCEALLVFNDTFK